MASPVGHTLAGLCLAAAVRRDLLRSPAGLGAVVLAANLPDCDFLPPLLLGAHSQHQGITHSLGFALAAALPLAWLLRGRMRLWRGWVLFSLAGILHLLLDVVSVDTYPPIGIPLFWPLRGALWHSPLSLLPGVDTSSFFNLTNLAALAAEVGWFLPPLLLLLRRRRARGAEADGPPAAVSCRSPRGEDA